MEPIQTSGTPENEGRVALAKKHNLWICVGRQWCTPDEYMRKYGACHMVHTENLSIRNPIAAIGEACRAIDKMVKDKKDVSDIDAATEKLMLFVKKIVVSGYRPRPNQLDRIDDKT